MQASFTSHHPPSLSASPLGRTSGPQPLTSQRPPRFQPAAGSTWKNRRSSGVTATYLHTFPAQNSLRSHPGRLRSAAIPAEVATPEAGGRVRPAVGAFS